MSRSRFSKGIQPVRLELTKSDSYTITASDCRNYGLITQTGSTKIFTLPVAATSMAGVDLWLVDKGGGALKVYVAAGFAGQGASYDTVDVPTDGSVYCYCDGSYWYVVGASPTGA